MSNSKYNSNTKISISGVLSESLKKNRQDILEIWVTRINSDIPASKSLDTSRLRDSLSKVLDQLITVLDGRESVTGSVCSTNLGREYGAERSGALDYDLAQVIEEYYLLRKVLFEVVRPFGAISESDNDVIQNAIDVGVRNASTEFVNRRRILNTKKGRASNVLSENLKWVVEAVHDHAIIQTDTSGIVRVWNAGAEKILGWNKEEIIGQYAHVFFTPEDRVNKIPEIEMSTAVKLGKSEDYRWHLKKDGSKFFAMGALYPLKDHDEKLSGYIKVFRDQTSRKMHESGIQKRERELQEFILQAPVAMVILKGPEFRFVVANPLYERLVGRKVEGKTVLEAFSPDEISYFIPPLKGVYESGVPYVGNELPLNIKDEHGVYQFRWLNFTYSPFRDVNGEVIGIVAVVIDVTSLVEARKTSERASILIENERENFYNLFRQTPEMVCVLSGPDHVFEFVNNAHIKALGFSAVGKSVRDAQPESVEVHGILDKVYSTGVTAELLEIPITVTDSLRYFNLTFSARKDSMGAIDGVLILGAEVTDVIHARKLLISSEGNLREFLNAIPTTLWSADPGGRINLLNQFWFEYTEQSPAIDLKAGAWTEPFHPDDVDEALASWMKAVGNGTMIDQLFRVRRGSDQNYRWHQSRGTPIRDCEGKIVRWAGYTTDIHDEITAINDLIEERELREKFVASLSHDLRTPLTSGKLSAELLKRKANDPKGVQTIAQRIISSMDRADRMIRNLLDANRLKAGEGVPISVSESNMSEIIDFVLLDLFQTYGPRFKYLDEAKTHEGFWDSEAIQRILENLCGNAIKYGKEKGCVTVKLESDKSNVTLSVHNYGNPIAPEDQRTLFDPFSRVHSEYNKGKKGWGIGLNLVKGLVQAHHGHVWVESSEYLGTTFYVRLPIDSRTPNEN